MKCLNKKTINFILILISSIVLVGCGKNNINLPYGFFDNNPNYSINEDNSTRTASLFAENLCATAVDITDTSDINKDNIYAAAMYDVNDKKVLYSYNANNKVNPASITKIMTALLVIENCEMEDIVLVPDVTINESGSQSFNIKEGDKISVENLLYATLVYSGNDAALALAKYVSGTEEEFCALMNERAKELGCTDTNFSNSNGLTSESQYTSVYDIYLIFNEATKHEEFLNIINCSSKELSYTSSSGEYVTKTVTNTNKYLTGDYNSPDSITIWGGKTGSTQAAGKCLVVYGKDQFSNPYISIVMGAADEEMLYKYMTAMINQARENN